MKQLFLIFILLTTFICISQAQLGGARVYAGISILTNQDVNANPEGSSYSGYHIGTDGRIMSGTMSFLLGARYTAISRTPQETIKLFGHDSNISILNGRVGLDYSIYSLRDFFRIRTKVLGSFDIIINTTGESIAVPTYDLNDGWFGGVTGLGFDIGPFILDIEYEFGILNAYYQKPDSKFNSLTISTGFFF